MLKLVIFFASKRFYSKKNRTLAHDYNATKRR